MKTRYVVCMAGVLLRPRPRNESSRKKKKRTISCKSFTPFLSYRLFFFFSSQLSFLTFDANEPCVLKVRLERV